MSDGSAIEFKHPFKLLALQDDDFTITNTDGHFAKMVIETGAENAQSLFEIARASYFKWNYLHDHEIWEDNSWIIFKLLLDKYLEKHIP